MIQRSDILAALEAELDDLLAAAPENLSEAGLKAVKDEALGEVQHVLGALSSKEIQSPLALERFIESTMAQARLNMHMR